MDPREEEDAPDPQRPILDLAFALSPERRADFLAKATESGAVSTDELELTMDLMDETPVQKTKVDDIKCGSTIGRYKILEKIGEGASANVYMVEQLEPVRRRVALKIIKLGMDTREVMARFDAEKQALAMMDHPNISRVIDAGATPSGRPYFVMELVKGVPITEYCDKNQMTPRQRLELLIPVCHAVQHAHVKGIIHRDLKPNNILVTLHDGVPVPKVIDFGIAKATEARLTDQTLFTKFHQFVGTPAYMSPEQAEMSGLDVDTRSDVYSLGVLIYELITGSTPFESKHLLGAGYERLRKAITEEEPPLPSTRLSSLGKEGLTVVAKHRRLEPGALSHQVRGELDWIVMKALDKDRTRRYQGAAGLAQDIQRYLDDEPVDAGPPNKIYRLGKLIRRHRGAASAAALVGLSLLAGTVLAMIGWRHARLEAADARLQANRADTVSHLLYEMFESTTPGANKGRHYSVIQLLDDFSRDLQGQLDREPEVEYSLRQILARAYEGLGEYLESEKHWRRSRDLARAIHGPDSAQVIAADVRLGWILHEMGHLEEARVLVEKSLARQQSLLGDDHPDCLETRSYLVEIWRSDGALLKAERLARETLAKYEILEKRPQRQWLWLLQNLAEICRDQGRTDEAEEISHRVMAVASQQHGEDNPHTFKAIHTLSQSYLDRGRLEDGEKLLRRGLDGARHSLGDAHPTTLTLQGDLAGFLQAQAKHDEAAQVWEAVLKQRRDVLGEDHPDTLRTMLQLVAHYRGTKHSKEAESLARGAANISRNQLGGHHLVTLDSVAAYLQVLLDEKRFAQAEPLARTSYETALESMGADHPATLKSQLMLGDLYMEMDRARDGEEVYREVFRLQSARKETPETIALETLHKLGRSLFKQRRRGEAQAVLQQVYDRRVRVSGATHVNTLVTLKDLGEVMLRRYCLYDAEAALKEAWRELANAKGMSEAWCLSGKLYAECVYLQKHTNQALAICTQVHSDSKRVFSDTHLVTQDCFRMMSTMRSVIVRTEVELPKYVAAFERAMSTGRAPRNRLSTLASLTAAYGNAEQYDKATESLALLEQLIQQQEPDSLDWKAMFYRIKAKYHDRRQERQEARQSFRVAWGASHRDPGQLGLFTRDVEHEYALFAETAACFDVFEALDDIARDLRSDAVWPPDTTRVLIPRASNWRYLHDRINDPTGWVDSDFSDLNWKEGQAPLGYPTRQLSTYINIPDGNRFRPITTYFRNTFEVESSDAIKKLKIRLRRNDGAIVHINGREVIRDNLPAQSTPETLASSKTSLAEHYLSNVFFIEPDVLRAGANTIAVEVHQYERPTRTLVFGLQLQALVD